MAFFLTQITEDTEMLIETETTGAFNKSALEVRPDPKKAFLNTVDACNKLGVALSDQLREMMESTGCSIDMQFGIKVDGNGSVMIAKEMAGCQFRVAMAFKTSDADTDG